MVFRSSILCSRHYNCLNPYTVLLYCLILSTGECLSPLSCHTKCTYTCPQGPLNLTDKSNAKNPYPPISYPCISLWLNWISQCSSLVCYFLLVETNRNHMTTASLYSLSKYRIAGYFRKVFIFGYFEEGLLFENKSR